MLSLILRLVLVGVAVVSAATYRYEPARSDLDLLRCYPEPSTTYWEGEPGYHAPTIDDYRVVRHCWKKNDVFMVETKFGRAAMAWRVATIKVLKSR